MDWYVYVIYISVYTCCMYVLQSHPPSLSGLLYLLPSIYLYIHIYIYTHTYMYEHIQMNMYVYTYVCLYVFIYKYIYTPTHTHAHTNTHARAHPHPHPQTPTLIRSKNCAGRNQTSVYCRGTLSRACFRRQ